MECRCNCGYTCGGPGVCKEPLQTCLREHFVQDCDHQWDGPEEKADDGTWTSGTCSKCGMIQMFHDMRCGP